MRNVTLSIDDALIKAAREYAAINNTTLNGLIRSLLEQTVLPKHEDWLEKCFAKMDHVNLSSEGKTWKREDLYAR